MGADAEQVGELMAEKVTLADFARNLGIAPATARQWKKRGKIVEVEGGFELIAEAQKEWLGITGRDAGVTVGELVTGGDGVTSKVTGVTVDCDGGVTVISKGPIDSHHEYCRDCGAWIELQSDWPICKSCHAKNPRTDCGGSVVITLDAFNKLLGDIRALQERCAALERDNEKLKKDVRATRRVQIDPPSSDWGA